MPEQDRELEVERILIDLPEDIRILGLKNDHVLLGTYFDDELDNAVICHLDSEFLNDSDYPGIVLVEFTNQFLDTEQFLKMIEMAFKSVVSN
jgi:hypothetical protein